MMANSCKFSLGPLLHSVINKYLRRVQDRIVQLLADMDYVNSPPREGFEAMLLEETLVASKSSLRRRFGLRNIHIEAPAVHRADTIPFGKLGYWGRLVDLYELRRARGRYSSFSSLWITELILLYRQFYPYRRFKGGGGRFIRLLYR